jgi:hypothetical protein
VEDPILRTAPPHTLPEPPTGSRDLFHTLAELIHQAGAHIAYGHLDDDATWDATRKTLTLRADAGDTTHTWSLSEFCRLWHLGPDYSHFVHTTPPRHLHAVS